MKTLTRDEIWDYIIQNGISSEETLKIITCINGFTEETLNDVIYAVTGYRDIEQIEGEEDDEEDEEN